MRRAALICASALLVGCGTTPNISATSTRGPEPTKAQAEAAILRVLAVELKDPDSIKQFSIASGPFPISWRGTVDNDGWLYCFEYNAKNSFGGYVGVKRGGYVLRVYASGDTDVVRNVNWLTASAGC